MEDLEILPKRRKLDPPVEQTNGHNVVNTSPLDNGSKAQETKREKKTNHHKEIKWNFKLVRPEVLKCCRRIVEGLNGTGQAGKRIDRQNGTVHLQQNGLTTSREKGKECTLAQKRKLNQECIKQNVDKETSAAVCVLPANCSAITTISRQNLGCREKNSEHTVNNQAPIQQHSPELLMPSSLTKEKVRDEIRKIIKDQTREAMEKAESLKSRISTLESENRSLKQKVATLYSALKKVRARQKHKEVLPTTTSNPQVKANGSHPVSEAAIKDKAKERTLEAFERSSATATNHSLLSSREAKGTPSLATRLGSQIGAPLKTIKPSVENKTTYNPTTSSAHTGSLRPILPFGEEEALSSVHLQNHYAPLPKSPVQQAFVPSKKPALDSGPFSSDSAPQHKATTSSSSVYTSKLTPSPASLLCQVLDDILATSKNDLPDQFTLNQQCDLVVPKVSKTLNETIPRSPKEIPFPRTILNGCEGVLHKQSSPPLKRRIPMTLLGTSSEKYRQGDTKTLLVQHRAEHLSPITPDNNNTNDNDFDREAFKAEVKHRESLGNSRNLENDGHEQRSTCNNNGTSQYRPQTEPHLSHSQEHSNVPLPTAYSSPARSVSDLAKWIPVTTSGCPSILESSGQSISLLDGIDMLAQAAGLKNTSTDSILCPEVSSKSHTPPLERTTPVKSIKIHNQDLSQQDLNNHAIGKANTPLRSTSDCSKSQSSPLQRIAISLPDELHKHTLSLEQHISTNGSLKGDRTGVVLKHTDVHSEKHVNGHHNSITAELAKPHININDCSFQCDKLPTSYSKEDASALGAGNLSNCDPILAAVSPNRSQSVSYHANSDPRFSNNRGCQEHTLKQSENTCVRGHVVSKPRYLPYPPIRPKVQQVSFIPVSSNIQYVTRVNERQSTKPVMPRLTAPLVFEGQSSQNSRYSSSPKWLQSKEKPTKTSNEELPYQPPRFSPETSLTRVRLISPCSDNANTSSSYNKETLLLQLLPSDRAPYIPRSNTAPTYTSDSSRAMHGFSQTVNAVHVPNKSFETSRRYVYLPPKTLVQNVMQNPKESSIYNNGQAKCEGIPLPSQPPPGESHRDGSKQTHVCSSNSVSLHANSNLKPQIELSQSCQRYLTQLKKSPLPFSKENSTYLTSKLIPQSESGAIDRNNGSRQTLKLPIPHSSLERLAPRKQECHDAQQVNSQTPTTQSNQRLNRILYHHKKFTNLQQLQKEHLGKKQSSSYHASNQQVTHKIKSGVNSGLQLPEKPSIRDPSSAATNSEA